MLITAPPLALLAFVVLWLMTLKAGRGSAAASPSHGLFRAA